LLAGLVCLAVSVACAAQEPLTLSEMASWKIVCSPAAGACESYAASEFQSFFRELTGLDLPIVNTVPEDAPVIQTVLFLNMTLLHSWL